MLESEFIRRVAGEALAASARIPGLYPGTCIVQWALETGWGTEPLWEENPANISPGGAVAHYPTRAAFLDAYVSAMMGPDYAEVRATRGIVDQLLALGRSPWATGHYHAQGQPQGESLVEIYREWAPMIAGALAATGAEPLPRPAAPAWFAVHTWEVGRVRVTVETRDG